MSWGTEWPMLNVASTPDNLIFICDTCDNVFDPGETGFQKLIDKARQAGWKITFHILKAGYATDCPNCH